MSIEHTATGSHRSSPSVDYQVGEISLWTSMIPCGNVFPDEWA